MSAPRFVVSFRSARLFVEVDADGFASAKAALSPFLSPVVSGDADEYAKAAQSVDGQEYSLKGAKEAGLLDEDGNAAEGVQLFQAE